MVNVPGIKRKFDIEYSRHVCIVLDDMTSLLNCFQEVHIDSDNLVINKRALILSSA